MNQVPELNKNQTNTLNNYSGATPKELTHSKDKERLGLNQYIKVKSIHEDQFPSGSKKIIPNLYSDKDLKYTAKLTLSCIEKKNIIRILDLPANLPDFNPVESV
ncbi:hypothetical protein ABPG72_017757 [Tetrahymena utriculariae]